MVAFVPDMGYEAFVAKIQKAKTRKDKDYFVLRITMPKEIATKIDAEPGEYVFLKAKKAEWFHMLDWAKMDDTWKMLPKEIQNRIALEGLQYPGAPIQMPELKRESQGVYATSSPTGIFLPDQSAIFFPQMSTK